MTAHAEGDKEVFLYDLFDMNRADPATEEDGEFIAESLMGQVSRGRVRYHVESDTWYAWYNDGWNGHSRSDVLIAINRALTYHGYETIKCIREEYRIAVRKYGTKKDIPENEMDILKEYRRFGKTMLRYGGDLRFVQRVLWLMEQLSVWHLTSEAINNGILPAWRYD